jgi:hypothetical protein
MATKNDKTAAAAPAVSKKYQVHEGIELGGDGGSWTALKSVDDEGAPVPLVGWALRTEPRTSPKFQDFIAGVIEITQPTVVVGGDGKAYEQGEGTVSVTMSVKKLEDFIPVFDDPEYISRVQIIAKGRRELSNGHTLQDYSFKLLGKMKRTDFESMKLAALQKQLTAGSGSAPQLSAGEA